MLAIWRFVASRSPGQAPYHTIKDPMLALSSTPLFVLAVDTVRSVDVARAAAYQLGSRGDGLPFAAAVPMF